MVTAPLIDDMASRGAWDLGPPAEWYWPAQPEIADQAPSAASPVLAAVATLVEAAHPRSRPRCRACGYLRARCKCAGASVRAAVA